MPLSAMPPSAVTKFGNKIVDITCTSELQVTQEGGRYRDHNTGNKQNLLLLLRPRVVRDFRDVIVYILHEIALAYIKLG